MDSGPPWPSREVLRRHWNPLSFSFCVLRGEEQARPAHTLHLLGGSKSWHSVQCYLRVRFSSSRLFHASVDPFCGSLLWILLECVCSQVSLHTKELKSQVKSADDGRGCSGSGHSGDGTQDGVGMQWVCWGIRGLGGVLLLSRNFERTKGQWNHRWGSTYLKHGMTLKWDRP